MQSVAIIPLSIFSFLLLYHTTVGWGGGNSGGGGSGGNAWTIEDDAEAAPSPASCAQHQCGTEIGVNWCTRAIWHIWKDACLYGNVFPHWIVSMHVPTETTFFRNKLVQSFHHGGGWDGSAGRVGGRAGSAGRWGIAFSFGFTAFLAIVFCCGFMTFGLVCSGCHSWKQRTVADTRLEFNEKIRKLHQIDLATWNMMCSMTVEEQDQFHLNVNVLPRAIISYIHHVSWRLVNLLRVRLGKCWKNAHAAWMRRHQRQFKTRRPNTGFFILMVHLGVSPRRVLGLFGLGKKPWSNYSDCSMQQGHGYVARGMIQKMSHGDAHKLMRGTLELSGMAPSSSTVVSVAWSDMSLQENLTTIRFDIYELYKDKGH